MFHKATRSLRHRAICSDGFRRRSATAQACDWTARSALPRLQSLKTQNEALGKRFEKLGGPTSKQDQMQVQQFLQEYAPIEKMTLFRLHCG